VARIDPHWIRWANKSTCLKRPVTPTPLPEAAGVSPEHSGPPENLQISRFSEAGRERKDPSWLRYTETAGKFSAKELPYLRQRDMPSIGFGEVVPWIGIAIVATTVAMVVVNRRIPLTSLQLTKTTILLLIGLLMVIVNDSKIKNFSFSFFGQHAELEKVQQLEQVQSDDIPDIKLKINNITDAISSQVKANADIWAEIKSFEGKNGIQGTTPKADTVNHSADFTNNGKYSVLFYYKNNRTSDAKMYVTAALSAGFKSSSVATDLTEVDIGVENEKPNTDFIIPSITLGNQAGEIEDRVYTVINSTFPTDAKANRTIKKGGVGNVGRANVVVYLY
jgi:hypothetical protein